MFLQLTTHSDMTLLGSFGDTEPLAVSTATLVPAGSCQEGAYTLSVGGYLQCYMVPHDW